ncbi:MAG: DUF1570 domain-containing protein [Planctomycetota bacterium]
MCAGVALGQIQGAWWDRAGEGQVGPYWIKTDLPAADAATLTAHLAFMHGEYSRRLGAMPARAPAPLNVLLFATRDEYLSTLELRFGIDAAGTGGLFFVRPSGSGLALWTDGLPPQRLSHVLRHEGFHQFAYSRFGSDLPMWVNEGLAEYFGEAVAVGGTLLAGQLTPRTIEHVQAAIENGQSVPFSRMLDMNGRVWAETVERDGAAGLYHQARAMVQFLIDADGGRYVGAFEAWLGLLNAGYPPAHAFKLAFKTDDIDSFEKRWKDWVMAARPGAFVTALERIEFLAEGARELTGRRVPFASMETLRSELEAIEYTTTSISHALEVEFSAADDRMYAIPRDALCKEDPLFRLRPLERRAAAAGLPPPIATEHLAPLNLQVRWRRDEAGSLLYEINW